MHHAIQKSRGSLLLLDTAGVEEKTNYLDTRGGILKWSRRKGRAAPERVKRISLRKNGREIGNCGPEDAAGNHRRKRLGSGL